jgi:hypothetical protein
LAGEIVNRRQFLQAFATIGVSVALAEKSIVQAITAPAYPLLFSGSEPYAVLLSFIVMGCEEVHRAGRFVIARTATSANPRVPLIEHRLSTYGGLVHHELPIGGGILISREHNCRLHADFDGVANLVFDIPGSGRVNHSYVLTREKNPLLRQQILLDRNQALLT